MSAVADDFYSEVMMRLGGSLVDVELGDCDFKVAFKAAKRIFIQKGHNNYRRNFLRLDIIKNQRTYELPKEVSVAVKVIKQSNSWSIDDPFHMAAYNDLFAGVGSGASGRADFLSYELTLQVMERWQRYAAHDAQFDFDEFRHTLTLHQTPKHDGVWLVDCVVNLDDDEYMQIDWIIRMTIALSKQILGAAYRKLGQVPGPDGPVQLPGSEMIAEGKEEEARLLEEIQELTDGAIDYNGITFG